MKLKQIYYDKINKDLASIKDQFGIINYLNQYVETLSKIICNGFSFNKLKTDIYRYKQQYQPISSNEVFKIIENAFKNIDEGLYNSFLNILYDSDLAKINYGTNPSLVYGEGLFLNLKNNTSDITEVTHESIHRIYNSVVLGSNANTFSDILKILFCEVNSITFESIINENIELDKDKFLEERLYSDASKAVYYMFVITVFKTYKKYGYVDNDKLNREINLIGDDNIISAINNNLSTIANVSYKQMPFLAIDLTKYAKYIIASVISKTLYSRITSGSLSYQEFLKMMLELNKIDSYEQALDILDVNYIKSKDKYNELNENYINTCKNICGKKDR